MAQDFIRFNYSNGKEDRTIRSIIVLKFLNFANFLKNNNFTEFRTEEPKYDGSSLVDRATDLSRSRFQIKILGVGKDTHLLELYYHSLDTVSMKVNLILYSNDGKRSLLLNQIQVCNVQAMKWHYATMITKQYFIDAQPEDIYLRFDFTIINDLKLNPIITETEVLNDFEILLNNGMFSDVTIISAEKIQYKVHKAVLASRSAVLKAHFEHNTTDGKVLRVDEIPEKTLVAADYYQLNRLKSLCEEKLQKKLTVHSAIETLQLADLYSADKLKQYTLEFIKDGQARLITKTEGWAKLLSAELIKEIYEYIMSDYKDFDKITYDKSLSI